MSMMMRRGMMVPKAPGGLPDDYLQVEYLESTGTQYIDTGYVPKLLATDTFTLEFSVLTGNTVIVFGNNNWYYQKSHLLQLPSINYKLRADVYTQGNYYFGTCTDGAWNTFTIENSNVSCLGTTYTYDPSYYSGNPRNLYLFCQGPNERSTFFVGRIRKAVYTSNGVPVFNLVPCIRIADSKPGMYDLVGRTFYTNQGTGEFIAGLAPDLSDTDFWSIHGYIRANGQVVLDENYRCCDYHPIIGGNSYTLSMKDAGWFMIIYFDDTYSRVAYVEKSTANSWTLAAPADTKYYRLYVEKTQTEVKFTMDN